MMPVQDGYTRAALRDNREWLRLAFDAGAPESCSALDALLATVSACAPEAHAHARRVARVASAVARILALPDAAVAQVEHAALLHDVGKLAIPESILGRGGALTSVEAALVRTHVRVGFDIISVVPFLRPAAAIVIATHERWDGTGYPAGLRGDEIPVGARIIAVADAYDALVSRGAGREPWSRDEAVAEIVRRAGSDFDPDVVRAWLHAAEKIECC